MATTPALIPLVEAAINKTMLLLFTSSLFKAGLALSSAP